MTRLPGWPPKAFDLTMVQWCATIVAGLAPATSEQGDDHDRRRGGDAFLWCAAFDAGRSPRRPQRRAVADLAPRADRSGAYAARRTRCPTALFLVRLHDGAGSTE